MTYASVEEFNPKTSSKGKVNDSLRCGFDTK